MSHRTSRKVATAANAEGIAAPAPIVIRFAHSLPIPDATFAAQLAAHIKVGGKLLFDGRDMHGHDHYLTIDEWLVRLDAEMQALGLHRWAASAPGYYIRGWTAAGLDLDSFEDRETIERLVNGSVMTLERPNGSLVGIGSEGAMERNRFTLSPHDCTYERAFGSSKEVRMPMRELRLGFLLTNMPEHEADAEDVAFADAAEAEALLLARMGGPL